ncbi:MAG: nucleotide exchange factor GrpE [Planctomycetota bacterium]
MNEPTEDPKDVEEAKAPDEQAVDAETPAPESEPTVEVPAPDAELAQLREERDQLEQKLQRAVADTQNILRRQRQELEDGRRRTLESITQELLPVLDTFGFALQSYDGEAADGSAAGEAGDVDALVEGVRMVRTMFSGALERHGLKEIPAAGQPFDPSRHEALGKEPNAEVPENQVLRVMQTGYMLGDRVVRHSKVIVAGPQPDGDGEE